MAPGPRFTGPLGEADEGYPQPGTEQNPPFQPGRAPLSPPSALWFSMHFTPTALILLRNPAGWDRAAANLNQPHPEPGLPLPLAAGSRPAGAHHTATAWETGVQ